MKKRPKTIIIPFPKGKFEEYRVKVKTQSLLLSPSEIQKVLIVAIEDFEKGAISSDELAAIGHELFKSAVKQKGIEGELFNVVLAASKLSFYIRNLKLHGQFTRFLEELFEFKNKNS